MGFASAYLNERRLFPQFIKEAPDNRTNIIVAIPAYNEPGICRLLDSLAACFQPDCKVEVITLINSQSGADAERIQNNEIALENILRWKEENPCTFFRLYVINADTTSLKRWGVGMARKTVMDEAVHRFNIINNPDGIIVSLDADCILERNYFTSIFSELYGKRSRSACSIYFEHPLSGDDFPAKIFKYITLYELHLRYLYQGIKFSGFPWVSHTLGSALAVKALPYVKIGGMNRKQAGEDFYFIQKLILSGGYVNLNSTTVYPSPRPSDRVPFGTGAAIEKLSGGEASTMFTYNIQSFIELRSFFTLTGTIYSCNFGDLNKYFNEFPAGIRSFLNEKEWMDKIVEIKSNTSGPQAFKKRFFVWFNMFRIVKYLNYVHQGLYKKSPVDSSAAELLDYLKITCKSKDTHGLLLQYRAMETIV